ncbi:DMT family transporter [Thermogemmatispora sp.]|uniref:DMT family transporter n=1 Tax=Thermogemmatispora sp. TaxID=1968838 RepID=UPI001D7496F9|nr:DMT family transporter [Thermogemmatispora sp.]MBX5448697.1 DMT family transporter [Thermogemmatispora sp.]
MTFRSSSEETSRDATVSSKASTPGYSWPGLFYACLAVFFFSTSPVFIRLADPFTSVEIAFWRLAIAALLVLLLGLITRQSLLLSPRELMRFLFYGLVTALHFLFYIASLSFTTIAHSLAIVYTSPIFVALFSALVLRETLPLRKYIGIAVAVIGVAFMAGFEPHYTACQPQEGHCMLLGDGLALLSAICYGIYSIAGRGERDRHPLFRYTFYVYGLAALWLLPVMLYFAFRHAYPLPALGAVVALGVLPLGLGHTLYNASLRTLHATYANLIATQEVTGGILLGVLWLHEIPSLTAIIGVIITLLGIISVLL